MESGSPYSGIIRQVDYRWDSSFDRRQRSYGRVQPIPRPLRARRRRHELRFGRESQRDRAFEVGADHADAAVGVARDDVRPRMTKAVSIPAPDDGNRRRDGAHERGRGRRARSVVRHQQDIGAQQRRIRAQESRFCLCFDVSGKQRAAEPRIDADHARPVVGLRVGILIFIARRMQHREAHAVP